MSTRQNVNGNWARFFYTTETLVLLIALSTLITAGCQNIIRRGQSPEAPVAEFTEDEDVGFRYIGDLCGVWGMQFAKVEGYGVVVNLDGTGENPKPSGPKEHLLRELKFQKIEDSKKMVASENTALVALIGSLPPGIRKGDRFDIEVKVLSNSETTSLEEGFLMDTRMRPMKMLGRSMKLGHVTGRAQGSVLINSLFESRTDHSNNVRGWILGGGIALEDRPLGLSVRNQSRSIRSTTGIARAINERFTTSSMVDRKGIANPKSDSRIDLVVPEEYRLNVGRFVDVIFNMAFNETATERVNRLEELDKALMEPALSRKAAIRLEAFGDEALPALKRALRHNDFEVRFNAAHAMAYMGHIDGLEVLKEAAKSEPAFRWHALTALASLEDLEAGTALAELMDVPSAETRYGAFRAIEARSPNDLLVRPKFKGGDFTFHQVNSAAEPMLHFSRSKKAEIVAYGEQTVSDKFIHVETGLTIRARGDGRVNVIRYTPRGEEKKVCSNQISDLIQVLVDEGQDYGMLVKMFRQAQSKGMLNTRMVVNAVPRIDHRAQPTDEVAGDIVREKSNRFVSGPLPELFRVDDQEDTPFRRVEIDPAESENEAKNESPPRRTWTKMKDWISGGRGE